MIDHSASLQALEETWNEVVWTSRNDHQFHLLASEKQPSMAPRCMQGLSQRLAPRCNPLNKLGFDVGLTFLDTAVLPSHVFNHCSILPAEEKSGEQAWRQRSHLRTISDARVRMQAKHDCICRLDLA